MQVLLTFNLLQRIFSETEACRELSEQWNESCELYFESRAEADESSPSPAVRVERVTTRARPEASPASPSFMRAKRRGICEELNFGCSNVPPECILDLSTSTQNFDEPFEVARTHLPNDYNSFRYSSKVNGQGVNRSHCFNNAMYNVPHT